MSKIQNILFGSVILVLSLATGYLGLQYAALKTVWEQTQESRVTLLENSEAWTNDLDAIKTALEKQQSEIAQIKDQWQSELMGLKQDLETNYLTKNPVVAVREKIFNYDESTLTVQGQARALTDWKTGNQVYLPQILKQSLSFTSDPNVKGVTISAVTPDSIFAQMGLKPGDRLLGLNGAPMNRSSALYEQLLTPKNGKLSIQRGEQNLILTLNYTDSAVAGTDLPDDTAANPAKIQVSETNYNTQKAVKIVSVDSNQVSTLKADDVVLSINGQTIPSPEYFYETLSSGGETPLKFNIVRNGKTEQVDVALSE